MPCHRSYFSNNLINLVQTKCFFPPADRHCLHKSRNQTFLLYLIWNFICVWRRGSHRSWQDLLGLSQEYTIQGNCTSKLLYWLYFNQLLQYQYDNQNKDTKGSSHSKKKVWNFTLLVQTPPLKSVKLEKKIFSHINWNMFWWKVFKFQGFPLIWSKIVTFR